MVERDLAKVDTGVRFPSLAPLKTKAPQGAFFVFQNSVSCSSLIISFLYAFIMSDMLYSIPYLPHSSVNTL